MSINLVNEILNSAQLSAFRTLDACAVANAIESFDVRLRNEGFTDSSIKCLFERLPAMTGYATTLRIRSANPPFKSHAYFDRTDWWNYLLTIPAPRIIVMQDMDQVPGTGAFVGEVHARIFMALGCIGVITNGAVRDLSSVEATGFHFFSGNVSVSHAYVHIVDFGGPVTIGGLKINPGDLVHGDRHGILTIPPSIAAEVPAAAERLKEKDRKIIELCGSATFSLERLRETIQEISS